MAEPVEHGYDSPRGREALRVVNRMHGTYDIDNDDMRYLLTTFIYDPLDWIERYDWRPLHPNERLAAAADVGLGLRAGALRRFPPRRTSRLTRDPRNRTYIGYPNGYHPRALGVATG